MAKVLRVGRKYAIYIPKEIVDEMKIKEGDLLVVTREGDKITLVPLKRPTGYWAEIDADEVEKVGEEITRSFGING
ncbi:AbrB family transcriptional regulator [Sulfolobus acidocaldarius SUSAZ]|nr:AbrB family transcriptional regulator [Sulfolobus acidocaldarius SUSAZ]